MTVFITKVCEAMKWLEFDKYMSVFLVVLASFLEKGN